MNKEELGKEIFNISYLTGRFKLRSGVIADGYFDKYQFESRPGILKELAHSMNELVPAKTQALAGLEMGAVPIVTTMSILSSDEIPVVFVRKISKEYGTCKQIEGIDIKGKNVCVVEDVVTSGGALLEAVDILRKEGARVTNALCVILRGDKVAEKLKDKGVLLTPLFSNSELVSINQAPI